MTWIRTPIEQRHHETGISRTSRLQVSHDRRIVEGLWLVRTGMIAVARIESTNDAGVPATAEIDLSSTELRHFAKVAADLADQLDQGA